MNKKDRLILAALIIITILGACLRLFYFAQLQSNPLPEVATQLEPFDEYRFMNQAKEFLETNWLGKSVPSYSVAYPYLIAFLYSFLPHHVNTIFIFQILCGIASIGLFYKTASLLFSNRFAGLIAAFFAAFYSPFLFQECDTERGILIAYANLLGFYFLLKALKSARMRDFFLSGLVCGASMALRMNALPVFIAIYLCGALKKAAKYKTAVIALFLAGTLAVVAPLAIRNKIVGNTFAVEYQGFKTFWLGNAYDSPGVGFMDLASSTALDKEGRGSIIETLKLLMREIKNHPHEYMSLYGRKIKMFLGSYEVPSNLSYDLFKEKHSALRFAFIDFGIICPLALAGLFLARRIHPFSGLLYLHLGVICISNILFHILGRYRIPAVPFFILLASYALYGCIAMLRERKFRAFFVTLLGIILFSLTTRPDDTIIKDTLGTRVRSIDYSNLSHAYFVKANEEHVSQDQKKALLEKAVPILMEAIKVSPRDADPYLKLGVDYYILGRTQEAIDALDRSIDLEPRFALAYCDLGIIYADLKDFEKAEAFLKEAVSLDPCCTKAHLELEMIYRTRGQEDKAVAAMQKAQECQAIP